MWVGKGELETVYLGQKSKQIKKIKNHAYRCNVPREIGGVPRELVVFPLGQHGLDWRCWIGEHPGGQRGQHDDGRGGCGQAHR